MDNLTNQLVTFFKAEHHRAFQYRYMIAEWEYQHVALIDATLDFILEKLEGDPSL